MLEDPLQGPRTANVQDRWKHFRDAVYNAAMSTFGKKISMSADWFEAHLEEMTPVIEAERNALTAYKTNPSEQNLHSSVPGYAPTTIGFSSASRFKSHLTQAISKLCTTASSGIGPNAKENCPSEISYREGDSKQRTTGVALGRTLH